MLQLARVRLLFLAFFLLSGLPALAAPQNPALTAHVGENEDGSAKSRNLAIRQMDVVVDVHGGVATTTLTASFSNSGDQALEGNFAFDLPAGAVVTGYGLDLDGRMVDGVLAAPRQAKRVYEQAVRRGIDPGLAEVTRANAFTNRIFPILAHKGRTIRLEFAVPLDAQTPLVIPLLTEQPVGALSIRVHATDVAAAPQVSGPEGLTLAWTRADEGWDASGTLADRALSGSLSIGPVTPSRKLAVSRHASGDAFFEINDSMPAAALAPDRGRVRLYWDSSRSRRDQDLSAEITLASHYISAVHARTVDVVFFADAAPMIKSFASAGEVETALRNADYRGATAMTSFLRAAAAPADACLLFSDGNFTVDSWHADRMPCPLLVVTGAKDANRGLLRSLARESGGAFADLGAQTQNTALARLLRQNSLLAEACDSAGHHIDAAVLPANGQVLHLVGPLPERGDILVKVPGEAAPRHYPVARDGLAGDDAAGALWAFQHIDDMNATDQPDRDQMLAIARRYSVASPIASFVVYENLQDYVQAGVEPPVSFGKKAVSDYRDRMAQEQQRKDQARKDRLERMVTLWREQQAWWDKKFAYKPRPKTIAAAPNIIVPSPPPPSNTIMAAPPPVLRAPAFDMVAPAPAARITNAEMVAATGAKREADPAITVTIAPWNSKRPYMTALGDPANGKFWSSFRQQEAKNGALPAFYLDVAEYLFRHDRPKDAIAMVLNALDLPSADVATMTIVADRLLRYGDLTRALWLDARIAYLEPDRPQPLRNQALVLIARAESAGRSRQDARADYAQALALLTKVVMQPWSTEYNGIEMISLMEANRIVPKLRQLGHDKIDLDPRLIALLDVDLRVVMEWNTDKTDMDLWVDEPTGQRAMYNFPKTGIGGRLSNDMTNGYGPEEYLLHRAPDGTYTVRVNVFATDRINPNGATTVRATVFQNYGRPSETKQTLELELGRDNRDASVVGTVAVKRGS